MNKNLIFFSILLLMASVACFLSVKPVYAASVTLHSSPVDLPDCFTTGGSTYSSPAVFAWGGDISHIVYANSPITYGGTTYMFSRWSDGGSNPRGITNPLDLDLSYTAIYDVAYTLTIIAGAGGSTSPASGTYIQSEGTIVTVTATGNTGFQFDHWILDGISDYATGHIKSVTMDENHNLQAIFARIPFVFANLQVTPTSCSQGAILTFSGNLYYQGTTTPPTNGDYTIQVLLSGLSVGTDHTLVSGAWSLTAAAPGSAGSYTYTCTAWNTPTPGTFSSVSVGYSLVISASAGGSTSPSPGTYLENAGVNVQITALPSVNYTFQYWFVDASVFNYSNPVTITMGASHTVQAVFQLTTPPADTTPPTFGVVTSNTTGAGLSVLLSCPVSDNVALSSYLYSWNNTGSWQNQTAVAASGSSVTATFSGLWNATVGNVVSVKVYANDTTGNWGVSGGYDFLLVDGVAPTFQSISSNATVAGSACLFAGLENDNLNLSGWLFRSNITGVFTNTTWTAFTVFINSTAAWSNLTQTLPGIVADTVQWQFLVNDSSNNWAASALQNLTLTSPPPGSLALVTVHVSAGGLFYVNGGLTTDNSTLNCTIGSTLSLAAVPSAGYSFATFLWTGGSSIASPVSYSVVGNDSIYVYFSVNPVTPSGPTGPGYPSTSSVQVTVSDAYVSATQGGSVSFELTVTFLNGGNLTVASVSASGNYAEWISLADVFPKTGTASVKVLLKCTPDWNAPLEQYTIPLSVGVQTTVGGALSSVSGTVYVTVTSSAVELGIIPQIVTIIMFIVSIIVGAWGFITRRH